MSSARDNSSALETYFKTVEIKPELLVKEKQFEKSLNDFYRQKWNCMCRPPLINGKPINLYKLYTVVMSNGGWFKVSNQDKWDQIAEEMGYSENISMIDNGIKLIYMRYLSKYEEFHILGDIDDHDSDIFGAKTKSKMYFNFASGDCPVAFPYRDKKVDFFENEYAKIVKSLYSGLPNEVDFAFNILTLMSHPGPYVLKLEKCPFLLNLLISHAGVYGDDKEIQSLAEDGWKNFCNHEFGEFWANSGIEDEQILEYIPLKALKKESQIFENGVFTPAIKFDVTNSTWFRILQVIGLLRNLSFECHNVPSMGKSDILIKFLCVCTASKHVQLVNDALDILSNIGNEIDLIIPEGVYCNIMLLKVISDCLHSDDKNKVIHSLDIIAALCQNEKNEVVCTEFMDPLMLNRIFRLSTVRDILICIHTLETLYQFSELGRASCNRIISIPNSIELLVSLLTHDAASFGRTGLSGIKVDSFITDPPSRQSYALPSTTPANYRPPFSSQPQTLTYHPPQTTRTVHNVQKIHHSPEQTPQALNPAVTFDEKLKTLTTKWIKDNVVVEPDSMALRGEMYSACVDHLRNTNGIMSGTVNLFTQTLQSIFPNTTLHSDQRDNKLNYYIKGVKFLKQSSTSVASSHPLIQKILTTPKTTSQAIRIVPALPAQTNGIPFKEIIAEEKSKTELNEPEVSINNEKKEEANNSIKEPTPISETLPETSVDQLSNDESMLVDSNENGAIEGEEEMMDTEQNDITETEEFETCSEAVPEYSLNDDENQNEATIVQVENSNSSPLIEETTDLKSKKLLNGHLNVNGEIHVEEKITNGVCNGSIESPENMKENGHIDDTSLLDNEIMDFDGALSDHEGEEEGLPEGDPAKIDETVEAVSKAGFSKTPKNGKINNSEAVIEEIVTTGNKKRKGKAVTPKATTKKAKTKNSVSEVQPKGKKGATNNSPAIPTCSESDFMCEWNACGQFFSSSEAISSHIIKAHLTDEAKYEDNTYLCLWSGCNKTRRAKWSLVTHFQDHHCQEHHLRQAASKRIEMGGTALYLAAIQQQFAERANEPEIIPTYTQAAAMDAIRRHSTVHYQRDFTDEQEGPVTKCIRLTTALILRNIARYSEEGRCKLRHFESQFCPLALSRLEASGALIQCLAEMDNTRLEDISGSHIYQPPHQLQQATPAFLASFSPTR